jgi:hypothetical protein
LKPFYDSLSKIVATEEALLLHFQGFTNGPDLRDKDSTAVVESWMRKLDLNKSLVEATCNLLESLVRIACIDAWLVIRPLGPLNAEQWPSRVRLAFPFSAWQAKTMTIPEISQERERLEEAVLSISRVIDELREKIREEDRSLIASAKAIVDELEDGVRIKPDDTFDDIRIKAGLLRYRGRPSDADAAYTEMRTRFGGLRHDAKVCADIGQALLRLGKREFEGGLFVQALSPESFGGACWPTRWRRDQSSCW